MAGLFKKILKGVLIGGGTVLSAFVPSLGGAVVTAGMAMNTSGNTSAEKKTVIETLDTVGQSVIDNTNKGILQPAMVVTPEGIQQRMVPKNWIYIAAAALIGLLLIKKR